ncbi:hypothetical protein QR680_015056 [Steinernema hermaphroditum]|uniref:Uncharacterized protein n=1 Tax=Steinernema hermaphroditum TaxID=289476 RepID=A0AA39IDK1_9BILA|nr:hypothetical protein QR680_015056 [Steinernema hermaphroditum]
MIDTRTAVGQQIPRATDHAVYFGKLPFHPFGTPETCKASTWPKDYPKIFKDDCPTAYSYAYDDHKSTFTCRGKNGALSAAYLITLC